MNQIIILTGIPGSGKSNWARKYLKKYNNTIIANRDDIRSSLGDYWVPKRESIVTTIETTTITAGLDAGYDVIIDATNLNPSAIRKWEALAKIYGATIRTVVLEVNPYTAVWRDFIRKVKGGRYVGRKVIMDFHKRYKT